MTDKGFITYIMKDVSNYPGWYLYDISGRFCMRAELGLTCIQKYRLLHLATHRYPLCFTEGETAMTI